MGDDLGTERTSVFGTSSGSSVRLDKVGRVEAELAGAVLSPEEGDNDGGEGDRDENNEL